MKMSDIFSGEVISRRIDEEALLELTKGESSGSDWHLEDKGYWLASTKDHVDAAAHAINCHDELVSALEEAIRAILINGFDPDCVPVVKLKYTLKKARGEL